MPEKSFPTILLFFFNIFILITGNIYADSTSRYPVNVGDILVFEDTYDVYDENGTMEVYNGYANEVDKIKRTVTERQVKVTSKDQGLKYGFPLKVGMKWDDDGLNRSDNMYANYVEKQEDVVTSAGIFTDCFKIVYDTNPDTETNWYCPGIGVVKTEYVHHGTLTNEIVELKKIIWK